MSCYISLFTLGSLTVSTSSFRPAQWYHFGEAPHPYTSAYRLQDGEQHNSHLKRSSILPGVGAHTDARRVDHRQEHLFTALMLNCAVIA